MGEEEGDCPAPSSRAPDGSESSSLGKSTEADGIGATQMGNKAGSWETLVLFAVNFTRLGVQMNMGNVMGNVV